MMNAKSIEKMHGLYLCGMSLAKVGKRFSISRQMVWYYFNARKLPMRALRLKPFVIYNGKKFTTNKRGYYRQTSGEKMNLNRYIWKEKNGEIPEGYDIRYIDKDRNNNSIDNLMIAPRRG